MSYPSVAPISFVSTAIGVKPPQIGRIASVVEWRGGTATDTIRELKKQP